MRSVVRGVVLASMIAVGPVVLWACEDESTGTGATPPPSGSVTTQPTTPIPGSSGNPGSNDAGNDTGASSSSSGGVVPHENEDTMKIMNFSGSPINACYRRQTSQDAFTGPLFRASGIPSMAISERVVFAKSNLEVKFIAAGEDCTVAGLHTMTTNWNTQQSPFHGGVFFTGVASGQVSGGFFEHLAVTPGKESVMAFVPPNGGRNPTFVRADDAGAPTNLRVITGNAVFLDPDVTGFVRGTGGPPPFPEVLIKTKAGGTLSAWVLTDSVVLCDERAPSKDGLTDCSPTIRSP